MSQTTNRVLFWLFVSLFIAGSIAIVIKYAGNFESPDQDPPLSGEAQKINTTVFDDDWTKGNKDANVILIEYTDLECPACATYVSQTEDIVREFGKHIVYVTRHNPLTNIHANAVKAAQATEAAGLQDKFWEMHDLLFEKQDEWSVEPDPTTKFKDYAQELEINVAQFEEDYNSEKVKLEVDKDMERSQISGLHSTPTFILNGERIRFSSFTEFREIISAEIRATKDKDSSTSDESEDQESPEEEE